MRKWKEVLTFEILPSQHFREGRAGIASSNTTQLTESSRGPVHVQGQAVCGEKIVWLKMWPVNIARKIQALIGRQSSARSEGKQSSAR